MGKKRVKKIKDQFDRRNKEELLLKRQVKHQKKRMAENFRNFRKGENDEGSLNGSKNNH